MDPKQLTSVDPVLAEKTRLAIMAYLTVKNSEVEFNELLAELELTKGNLASHLRKLESAEYIIVQKEFVGRKPRTSYRCTDQGRDAVKKYLQDLERIAKWVGGKE